MGFFAAIHDSFRLDALLDFLKMLWSFGLVFPQMGFSLITTMIKNAKQRHIQNPVKHLQ